MLKCVTEEKGIPLEKGEYPKGHLLKKGFLKSINTVRHANLSDLNTKNIDLINSTAIDLVAVVSANSRLHDGETQTSTGRRLK